METQEDNKPTISSLISDILKKYGLEESFEDINKKLINGKLSNAGIINNLSKDLIDGLISEPNFISALEKNFNIQKELAKQILGDIKKIILPPLKKIIEKRAWLFSDKNMQAITKNSSIAPIHKIKQIEKNILKPLGSIEKIERPKPKGPDTYREPIK